MDLKREISCTQDILTSIRDKIVLGEQEVDDMISLVRVVPTILDEIIRLKTKELSEVKVKSFGFNDEKSNRFFDNLNSMKYLGTINYKDFIEEEEDEDDRD